MSVGLRYYESRTPGSELDAWDRRIEGAASIALFGIPASVRQPPQGAAWCSNEWFEWVASINFPSVRSLQQPKGMWPTREWYVDAMLWRLIDIRMAMRDKRYKTAVALGIQLGRLSKEAELKFSGLEQRAASGEKVVSGSKKGGKARADALAEQHKLWLDYAKSLDPKRYPTIHKKARQIERHFKVSFETARRVLRQKLGSEPRSDPGRS